MKHQIKTRKLSRTKNQRNALLKSLMNSLVKYEKIKTTAAKAKELRPRIEKLVTKAKKPGLAAERLLISRLNESSARKLIKEIAPKYIERKGGYTRISKLGPRKHDGSLMAIIEFV